MSRPASPATEIRNLKRLLAAVTKDSAEHRMQARIAEGRLTKVQQEVAEWKRRFDALLASGFKEAPSDNHERGGLFG